MTDYTDRTLQGLSGREGLSHRGHSDQNTHKKIAIADIMDDDDFDDETTIKEVPMQNTKKSGLSLVGVIAGLLLAVTAAVLMAGKSPTSMYNDVSSPTIDASEMMSNTKEGISGLVMERDDRALKKNSRSCCSTDGVHCDINLDKKCHDKEDKCTDDKCGGTSFMEDERFCCSADGVTCDKSLKDKCHDDVDDCLKCGHIQFIIDYTQLTHAQQKLADKFEKMSEEWREDPDSKKTKKAIEKYHKEIEKQQKKGGLTPLEALELINTLNEFLSGGLETSTSVSTTASSSTTTLSGSTATETVSTGTPSTGSTITTSSTSGTTTVDTLTSSSASSTSTTVQSTTDTLASTTSTTTSTTSSTTSTISALELDRAPPDVVRTLTNDEGKAAGRSYDGMDWEPVYPLLLEFDCSGSSCSVEWPDSQGGYRMIERNAASISDEAAASRLLMQTTYGPTQTLIDTVKSMTPEAWIASQMDEEPTFHREHIRKRMNTRLRQPMYHHGVRDACEPKSRWNRYAFTMLDFGKSLETTITDSDSVLLLIDGIPRAELPDGELFSVPEGNVLCDIKEYVGGLIFIGTDDDCHEMNATYLENPLINFRDTDALNALLQPPADAFLEDLSPAVRDSKLLISLKDDCNFLGADPVFIKAWTVSDYTGSFDYYMFDKRIELTDNSLGSSTVTAVAADAYCPHVQKTFLNQDSCKIVPECSAPTYTSTEIQLDDTTIRQFYLQDGVYVYRINDLRLEETDDAPCDIDEEDGKTLYYRWIRRDALNDEFGCPRNQTELDESITDELLLGLMQKLNTTSSDMLVVDVPNNLYSCSDENKTALGASLFVPGSGCWTHSHIDEWSIFDFSRWTMLHDGNDDAFLSNRRNPIAKHAEQGFTTIDYPGWKPMERWEDRKWIFKPLGIYGETIDYSLLDSQIQAPKMASYVGAIQNGWADPGLEVCGSPGEIANDPTSGNQYKAFFSGDQDGVTDTSLDQDHGNGESKQMLWYTVALIAKDQLRQRIAWALSQIFVVTENDVPKQSEGELWGNYYDIFVRHAFGDFGSLLKEVSLSPIMGEMLTFIGTKSLAFNIEDSGQWIFPDENFAREIWQLFTIGLWKLHMNGTQILDEANMPIQTYGNRDIVSMARGWTGLERETSRGNYESWNTHLWPQNTIDPMRFMTKDTRDGFPKVSIEDQGKRHYIGDGIQRCDAMPDQAFLKKGAIYRYLGSSGVSELNRADPHWWDDDIYVKRLVLSDESNLFAALCNEKDSQCQFGSYVTLMEDLECVGECSPSIWGGGNQPCECTIDEPRVVTLPASTKTGTHLPTHFEYVKAPCIRLAFPDAETIAVKERKEGQGALCADARLPEAATSCCPDEKLDNAKSVCVFAGERMTYAKAEEYCQEEGLNTCTWTNTKKSWECGNYDQGESWRHWKAGLQFLWTNSPCSVRAQINQDGDVAIVHDVSPLPNPVKGRVAVDTGTYFGVFWEGETSFPRASAGCGSCETRGSTCLCDAVVTTEAAFTAGIPDLSEILAELHIGAPDTLTLDGYSQSSSGTGFLVHTKNAILDVDTIFEVLDGNGGPSAFLMNMKSTVSVDGNNYSFRNPPMMNSLVDSTRRDAMYELDEMLDLYATHSNVAPFISSKLISLLVTSNPSPAYVETVATAFRDGQYGSFGSGKYGDLGAAVAAIFLHPEARSMTLDADPTHGTKREPVLQLMHYLRAMELGTNNGDRELNLRDLRGHIGQEPHNAPSVFNFFLAEFSPAGPVFDSGLVSPQSQALVAPIIMETINGYSSLPRFGLTNCADGLGDKRERYVIQDTDGSGIFECSDIDDHVHDVPLNLQWMPTAWSVMGLPDPQVMNLESYRTLAVAVIEEMNTLLTGGKLEKQSQEVIVNAYIKEAATTSMPEHQAHLVALQVAQQLFAVTPEFQITNRYFDEADAANPIEREPVVIEGPEDPEPVTGYKAIAYLFLDGGADTFSLIVPKEGCTPGDLPDQYYRTRGDVAINATDLLEIVDSSGSQPCSKFGLHPSLQDIQTLYNNKEAAVIAGIGPLIQPTTKVEFDNDHNLPLALFAHNTQRDVTQTLIPQDSTANGVLGRIGDAINEQESMLIGNRTEIFDAYSISGTPAILAGAPGVSRVADVLTGGGVSQLGYAGRKIESDIKELHNYHATSIFGETVSASYASTFQRVEVLKNAIDETGLDPETEKCFTDAPGWFKWQLRTVARVIKRRDVLEAKRDVFYTRLGGFDTHSDNGPIFAGLMTEVNAAIKCFVGEMKKQGIWQDITIVTASEFARTMTSNGLGTDHAWSGNHLVMGGSIKGKQIFGKFPNDLTENGSLNIGRGRLIPECSWDFLWNALGKWFGLNQENIDKVLPNARNFPNLLEDTDLYG